MVCGLMRLLGFDYRPQLADLPDAKLWWINTGADYGPLATAARGKIDLGRVRAHWPDLLRLAGSIHTGAVSAHDVLRMLAHGGNPTQLGDALAHYGRIFKTLHVLSYVDQAPYRAQIKGVRNLQEGRHDLARHVFHGRRGDLRRAYHEGMEDQLGALGLVLNCITLWNTVYLDAALTQLRDEGYPVRDEDVVGSRPTCAATSTCTGTTRSTSPTSPGPAARCATLTPATTKSADRCRATGAELQPSRLAVPDGPAA
jgi:TnpA family transposase